MENKSETLRQYLDRIHIDSGDDSGFVVKVFPGGTTYEVSRRYLESEPMKYILDKTIIHFEYPYYNLYGQKTILFVVE